MFRLQAGCVGVLFLRTREDRTVLSLWADESAVATLSSSLTYQETAQRLTTIGVLAGTPTVEVFQVHGGFLEGIGGEER